MIRPKLSGVLLLVVFGLMAGCSCCEGSLINELAAGEQTRVKRGEQILVSEKVAGKPWPKVKIYRTVNATPEEVAAVFCDFNHAKDYVPNVLKSEVSHRVSPCIVDVDYGLDVPILPDEYYTTRNSLTSPAPNTYRVDWKLLRAVQTKDSIGCLRVEPFEDGKALICYENLVTPGSKMAGLLKGKALQQMGETVAAIAARVESQKTRHPQDLKRSVETLREMLKGTNPRE
jgi:hypothetical protein